MDIQLSSIIVLEVNHYFETYILKHNPASLVAFILLGNSKILKCSVLIDLNVDLFGNLGYSEELLEKKTKLIQTIYTDIYPVSVLLINSDSNNVEYLLKKLTNQYSLLSYFTYIPDPRDFQLYQYQDMQLTYRIPYRLLNDKIVTYNKPPSKKFQDCLDEQNHVKKMLIERIDNILNYLNYGTIDDRILRNCWLLVSELCKPATQDIDQLILEREVDWETLQILCKQWETVQYI